MNADAAKLLPRAHTVVALVPVWAPPVKAAVAMVHVQTSVVAVAWGAFASLLTHA